MKKFGTPICAGPGTENEKVGLAGVGTPPPPRGAAGVEGAVVAGLGALPPEDGFGFELDFEFDEDCWEGFWGWPPPVVFGACEEPPPPEPEPDPDPEPEPDPDPELEELVLVVGGGAQDSEMLFTGPIPEGINAEAGVLGEAVTL